MPKFVEQFINYADQLPPYPERIGLYTGLFGLIDGMHQIEFGNPLMGGTLAVLGTLAMCASTSTASAREALDNTPHS